MLKIVTLIGARPQIIKAAAISRAIKTEFSNELSEVIVHTGQHYDANMSAVFFEEMDIPAEKYNLAAGGGSHAEQTAKIMVEFEKVILIEKPDVILLYGDTNSTLAAALVGSKLKIPIVHVEGGVRINTKDYPEEINRILTDNLSSLIFVPNLDGVKCLKREGFDTENTDKGTLDRPKVVFCGDIMYDNSLYYASKTNNTFLKKLGIAEKKIILLTLHRHNLSEDESLLRNVFSGLENVILQSPAIIVFPVHPRTKKLIDSIALSEELKNRVLFIEPVSYLEMIELEEHADLIMTDSGGVQKEAYFFKKPSLILLENTPWIELVESGTAMLCGYDKSRITDNFAKLMNKKDLYFPDIYGDGRAAYFICEQIKYCFTTKIN